MEKQQKKSNSPRVERKRYLNIVYFVDAARTRSVSISLTRVTVILSVAGAIVTWALIGSGFVYYLVRENIKHRTSYRSALTAIFDYQSRYDGVYERAYPNGKQLRSAGDTVVEKKVPPADDESELGDADFSVAHAEVAKAPVKLPVKITAPALLKVSPPIPVKVAATQNDKVIAPPLASNPVPETEIKAGEQPPGVAEWMLDLEKPSVEKKGQGFDLNFALRNRQKDMKAGGYVWAIATVISDSGETVHFPAPINLALDRLGNATDGRRAHKFSIRHYIAKKFSFQTPKGVSGILTNIDIGLMNQDGTSKVFKVPLKFKVDLPVPQPAGTEPAPAAKSEGDSDEPAEQGA